VAIKKLHLSAANAAHRELRIADELKGRSFEHVVPFIDAGEDADTGDYFVVMPRADGSLQSKLDKDGALSASDTAVVLLQIVKGLIEVGELVHRDLKPDNILIHGGMWKIADFGIARFVEEATSSNTLKDCLSPLYAAPEQWRFERATHATDVYSLGCIAFCLLTGKAPFLTNPSEEHQNAPVPPFVCADSRFRSLINMMLRKVPATRPTLSRVRQLLAEGIAKPQAAGDEGALAALAGAAARVADKEQQMQAQQQAKAAAHEARLNLARGGFEILKENVERLWGKIQLHAPNVYRVAGSGSGFQCQVGNGWLLVNTNRLNYVESGSFPLSGWDVVAYSRILVNQIQPEFYWSASLWFMKVKGSSEYRWYEASYWHSTPRKFEPYAESPGEDADCAAANVIGRARFAFGPCLVDDEHEDAFHDRWIWLLSKAVDGQLHPPSQMPFGWPPPLL
jgi:serine/threonine-protein kinase